MIHNLHHLLEKNSLFADLPADITEKLITISRPHSYGQGDCVFLKGDHAVNAYMICEGQFSVRFDITNQNHQRQIGPGNFIGETILIIETNYSFSLFAEQDGLLASISRHDFRKILYETPELALRFQNKLEQQLATSKNEMDMIANRLVE